MADPESLVCSAGRVAFLVGEAEDVDLKDVCQDVHHTGGELVDGVEHRQHQPAMKGQGWVAGWGLEVQVEGR